MANKDKIISSICEWYRGSSPCTTGRHKESITSHDTATASAHHISSNPRPDCELRTDLCLTGSIKIMLKVAIQSFYLALLLHRINNFVRIISFLADAPLFSFQDFGGSRVAFILEPVEDPLIEVVFPMIEGVRRLRVSFAKPVCSEFYTLETLDKGNEGAHLPTKYSTLALGMTMPLLSWLCLSSPDSSSSSSSETSSSEL